MYNLKILSPILLISLLLSLISLCVTSSPWRLNERNKLIEMISVLKEPKCPAIVVVLDTSSIDSDEVDANDFLVEKLIDEFPFPLTLLETSSNSTLDMWNGNQVKPKNHIEPVCSNVVIISNQAGKLQSLHRQVKDHYYVDIALIVLTQQGKAQEIDVVIKDVRNENLFGVLERPGRMTEIRFGQWTMMSIQFC
jgi:hypothetical protein